MAEHLRVFVDYPETVLCGQPADRVEHPLLLKERVFRLGIGRNTGPRWQRPAGVGGTDRYRHQHSILGPTRAASARG